MTLGCVGLPDAHPQSKPAIQARVRQIKITAAIQRFQQALVRFVSGFQIEANQI